MNSSVANRIRNGTSWSKTEGGVQRSSSAPAIPPIRLGPTSAKIRGSVELSSRRYPAIVPSEPGQIAPVLVALAVTESSPIQISVGKVSSVPPPATELIAPATNAEPKAAMAWERSRSGIRLKAGRRDPEALAPLRAGGDALELMIYYRVRTVDAIGDSGHRLETDEGAARRRVD